MKILSPDLDLKKEVGGVVLHIADAAALTAARRRCCAGEAWAPAAAINGFLVLTMAEGWTRHPRFRRDPESGPVVLVGAAE